MSLAGMFELYLERSDLRPASVRFKRRAFRYFMQWFGDMPPETVTIAIAEDYRTRLAKGRSKRAANGYLANLKPFFKWLARHGQITQNPFSLIAPYRIAESKRATFKAAELSRLLQAASRLWRVRICLGLLGLRRGEVLNIVVADIDLSPAFPHITISQKKATATTWPWHTKNRAIRMVALPRTMRVPGYVAELEGDVIRLIEDLGEQPYLCIEPKYYRKLMNWQAEGKLTDEDIADPTGNFQRQFRNLQTRAAVRPTKRFHELRAAFATKMIAAHGIEQAADALGHSSIETTRVYDRRTQESLVAEIGLLASKCYET